MFFRMFAVLFFSGNLILLVRTVCGTASSPSPESSADLIREGIESERAGDLSRAEELFLEAAQRDHQFLPAWTLANYYFRRNDPGKFWPWAQRAAGLTFDDHRPLLRLCDELEPDSAVVSRRLNLGPVALRHYMDFLIGNHRLKAAREVASRLRDFHDPADDERFEDLASREHREASRP